MSDNIADITKNRPGIRYNAYIDGQWIVMQHDLKSHTLKQILRAGWVMVPMSS